MKIGVQLPTRSAEVGAHARRAEELGLDLLAFTTSGSDSPEAALLAQATAAAVTDRIPLFGDVAFGPLWSAGTHARHAAEVDRISGGRFTSGITFAADSVPAYGLDEAWTLRMIDAQLAEIHRSWPTASGSGPRLLIGGPARLVAGRIAGYADGWVMRAGSPEEFADGVAEVRAAWNDADRVGPPTATAVLPYAVGDAARTAAVAPGTALGTSQVRDRLAEFAARGADQVLAVPVHPGRDQLDGLAAARPQPAHV